MIKRILTSKWGGRILRGPFAKLVRHGVLALGGYLAGHEVLANAENADDPVNLLAALLAFAVATVWSLLAKSQPGDYAADQIKKLTTSISGHLVTMAGGFLASQNLEGIDGSPETTTGFAVALLSYILSTMDRKDATGTDPGPMRLRNARDKRPMLD